MKIRMGCSGYEDDTDYTFGMPGSSKDYFDEDESLLHIDYAAAERKLAWSSYRMPEDTACELKDARVIRRTEKALMVTAPALNAPAWIPKSIIISYTPLTIPGWFAQKLLDNDITATPGDFEGLCPYCGGQHCDCGTDI